MEVYELIRVVAAGYAISEPGLIVIVCATIAVALILVWSSGKKAGRRSVEEDDVDVAESAVLQSDSLSGLVQDGISEEVVAVIAAAVAAMAPEGTQYTLRSVHHVSRVKGERPVWAAAGLAESTRPF